VTFVRHVIFDLDGTLIDSLPGIAWSVDVALRSCGLPPAERDLGPFIGPPVRDILAAVSGVTEPGLLDTLVCNFRYSYDSEGWRRSTCYAGVREMLLELRSSGEDLWVLTNKPALVTGRILGELKLDGFFREVACRDSRLPCFASKAEVLIDLLQRNRIGRAECLMVGDTVEDWRAAEAAGISCAIVAHGYGARLLPSGCRRIAGWHELQDMCTNRRATALARMERNN
jgi:phosphoglycolate phosphatase